MCSEKIARSWFVTGKSALVHKGMGLLSGIWNAAAEANEEAHGARLRRELDDAATKLGEMQKEGVAEVVALFVSKRSKLIQHRGNWTVEGRLKMATTLRNAGRERLDFNVVEAFSLWMASAWLESGERRGANAAFVHDQLEALAARSGPSSPSSGGETAALEDSEEFVQPDRVEDWLEDRVIAAVLILFADSYARLRNTSPEAMTDAVAAGPPGNWSGSSEPQRGWQSPLANVATETWLVPHISSAEPLCVTASNDASLQKSWAAPSKKCKAGWEIPASRLASKRWRGVLITLPAHSGAPR